MKTNKQIYLMMENVGRELYQTINSKVCNILQDAAAMRL